MEKVEREAEEEEKEEEEKRMRRMSRREGEGGRGGRGGGGGGGGNDNDKAEDIRIKICKSHLKTGVNCQNDPHIKYNRKQIIPNISSPVSLTIVSPVSTYGIITDFLYAECSHMVTEFWAPLQNIDQSSVNTRCSMLTQYVECISVEKGTPHIKNEITWTAQFRMGIRGNVYYVGIWRRPFTYF